MEKLCYLGDMISCYGGASDAASGRIDNSWKKFSELTGALGGKQGLTLKQQGRIYQCCITPVLLYCGEMWELTSADDTRLRGVGRRLIRMMCGVRLVDKVSTDILRDRVGVVEKIEDMIIQSRLRWYGHIMRGDINFQIREVMEAEIKLGKERRFDQRNRGKSASRT